MMRISGAGKPGRVAWAKLPAPKHSTGAADGSDCTDCGPDMFQGSKCQNPYSTLRIHLQRDEIPPPTRTNRDKILATESR